MSENIISNQRAETVRQMLHSLWHGKGRWLSFWLIFVLVIASLDYWFSGLDIPMNFSRIMNGLRSIGGTDAEVKSALASLSDYTFAFSLAFMLGAIAFGFIVTFGIMHCVYVSRTLKQAKTALSKNNKNQIFAHEYSQRIYPALKKHPLIGHAWKEFDETLLKPRHENDDPSIKNTLRPQSFINMNVARERLFGLKMMSSIPGYFVGIGLLLTFIGIVIALKEAGQSASSDDVSVVKNAMAHLLDIASFKFATSIAGLGASIVLSLFFKIFSSKMEKSFSDFCEAAEDCFTYTAPQSIAHEMKEAVIEQRDQLKEINSAEYFAKMGKELSPQIQSAFQSAIAPVTQTISSAVDKLAANSQSGVSDLLKEFSTSVQSGAGTELRELSETLKVMQLTLANTQQGLNSSGEDFSRRLSEAAENLNRLVSEAGGRFGESAEHNRAALGEMIHALQATFQQANMKVDQELGQAASGASCRIEEAMGRVFEKLEGQMGQFMTGLSGFQDTMHHSLGDTQIQVREAQRSAVNAISSASIEVAKALEDGLANTLSKIREEVTRFETSLKAGNSALSYQASAIQDATSQTRIVSDALSRTAENVHVLSTPLLQTGEKISAATEKMSAALSSAAHDLSECQKSAQELTQELKSHIPELTHIWQGYEKRFSDIDQSLAGAINTLSSEMQNQSDKVKDYAKEADKGLADAIGQLQPLLQDLADNSSDFGENVKDLKISLSRLRAPVAAE